MLEAHDGRVEGRGRGKKSSDVHDIFCQGVKAFLILTHKLNAGHPRRHLLTTGWSVFVSSKRLVAGDSVLFLRYVVSPTMITLLCLNKRVTTGYFYVCCW